MSRSSKGLFFKIGLIAASTFVLANPISANGIGLYTQIRDFKLTGGSVELNNHVFKRDRVQMTLTGTVYFASPADGRSTGAVFVGQGNFKAVVPPNDFEAENIRRMLGVHGAIESDFKTAVFRFSDDTFEMLGKNKTEGIAVPDAQSLAIEHDGRVLKETGTNLSSRILLSILNKEDPGFFFATFNGGKRGRFSFVFDYQTRVLTDDFGINAGERGLVFKYDSSLLGNDIWMAFHSLADYEARAATYSDQNDLVDIQHYDMNVDLRDSKKRMTVHSKIRMLSRVPDLRAVKFTIGEGLGEYDDARLDKQMRVKSARIGGTTLDTIQEDWEAGLTIILPESIAARQPIEVEMELVGDFLTQPDGYGGASYPRSNSSWYPRHGYLDRATFSFSYTHPKKYKVASGGTRVSEQTDLADKDSAVSKYEMKYPVALVTFALGPFQRHTESIKWENGDKPTPLEFNSMPGNLKAIKEDFILAELNNSVRYFQELFGKYPYETYSAVFHPYGFGQGFATMLTIPNTDRSSKYTFAFISHETAHQWWGNIVSWRSYRDQWLSEGFAEYSGVLYTGLRDDRKAASQLIDDMRRSLKDPPITPTGPGKGKLVDVGPIIWGRRLETRKTFGAYSTLVYNKGGLVLRMLHFLLTDPGTGDGKAFFDMMKDFVNRYRDRVASTDDFRIVANEHFARSPLARKYGLKDLNWFFAQWVYDTALPSYKLEYQIQPQPDGSAVVSGNVIQEDAPAKFFMPLPLNFKFAGGAGASGTVAAYGPKAPFSIKLPRTPESIELDPHRWVLSEKTSTK